MTFKRGVHTPGNIESFNNHIITDISATGFSFVILINSGKLYHTGHDWRRTVGGNPSCDAPGPSTSDYSPPPSALAWNTLSSNPRPLAGRQALFPMPSTAVGNRYDREVQPNLPSGRRMQIQPILTRPPEQLPELPGLTPGSTGDKHSVKETNFVTELKLPPNDYDKKLISISSGRQHIVALDDCNNIYTWDTGVQSKVGVKLRFGKLEPVPPIIKIFAGWNISAMYVNEIGLIVWNRRQPLTQQQFETEDRTSETNYQAISGTRGDIEDFTIGDNFVIFTRKSDGKVYRANLIGDVFVAEEVGNFNEWLRDQQVQDGTPRRFTRLNCCFKSWVVFTDNDEILIGNGANEMSIVEAIQHENIKSVEIGDYHFLALTSQGEVYSWGRESEQCGCLGLGDKTTVLEHDPTVRNLGTYDGIQVYTPKKVINPTKSGKWVQIASSGWHSGGIYVADE